MKIVVVHNRYQIPGGEDRVFDNEASLLESKGHSVFRYTAHNMEIARINLLPAAAKAIWNRSEARKLRAFLEYRRPDFIHFHNTFPLISPAAYYEAHELAIPVVQTLHNYRLLCPNAILFRDGKTCEDCLGRSVPWPGVLHGCYRSSRAASGVVAGMLAVHRALGTWQRKVDRWIALTQFAKEKFIQGGLPAERIAIKPNFVPDPSVLGQSSQERAGGLFVGRLTYEKGVPLLFSVCALFDFRMDIIGDGPLGPSLKPIAPSHVQFHGHKDREAVSRAMRGASFLVVPSNWYEGFPMVLIEALANGLPVIASRIGALAEIVEDGVNGFLFEPGSKEDLIAKLRWAYDHPAELRSMGVKARQTYEERYGPAVNYEKLIHIYEEAATQRRTD